MTDPATAAAPAPSAPAASAPLTGAAAAVPVGFTSTDALLACVVVVWGVNYIVIKAAMREIEPLAFNAARFALAATALAAIAWRSGARRPAHADLGRLALMGLIGNTIYQFGFIEGVAHTRAGNAALIMAAVPVETALISHARGHDRLRGRDLLGLLVATAGIATIVLGSRRGVSFGGGSTIAGDLLVLAATACWSVYVVGTKPLADRYGAVTATAWTMAVGAVPLVLLSIPAVASQPWRDVSLAAWAGLILSALGALVIAYLIWFRGIRRLGPARTALYSNFTPVVVMLAAWPALGETPTAWQVLGAAGIFTGVALART